MDKTPVLYDFYTLKCSRNRQTLPDERLNRLGLILIVHRIHC